MKKTILATTLLAGAISAQAAIVTYDFNTGLGDSTSGADLDAGATSYAVGTQSDGSPDSFERAWDQTSTSGNYLLNFGQRGLGRQGVDDADLAVGAAATLQFTLNPNSGELMDFSASTLDFDSLLYTDGISSTVGYKIWANTGSGFVALAALQTATSDARTTETEGRLKQTDESTDLSGFSLTDGEIRGTSTSMSFDISSLGALTADQSVTFAIAMSATHNNQFNFGNGIDNLVVDNIVIPEPATLGLVAAFGIALIALRHMKI